MENFNDDLSIINNINVINLWFDTNIDKNNFEFKDDTMKEKGNEYTSQLFFHSSFFISHIKDVQNIVRNLYIKYAIDVAASYKKDAEVYMKYIKNDFMFIDGTSTQIATTVCITCLWKIGKETELLPLIKYYGNCNVNGFMFSMEDERVMHEQLKEIYKGILNNQFIPQKLFKSTLWMMRTSTANKINPKRNNDLLKNINQPTTYLYQYFQRKYKLDLISAANLECVDYWLNAREEEGKTDMLNSKAFSEYLYAASIIERQINTKLIAIIEFLYYYFYDTVDIIEVTDTRNEEVIETEYKEEIKRLKQIISRKEQVIIAKQGIINSLDTKHKQEIKQLKKQYEQKLAEKENMNTVESCPKEIQEKECILPIEKIADRLNSVRILVIGGHDSWVSSISKFLTNIKSVPAGAHNRAYLNATTTDVLLIKRNYITHSLCDKYIGTAKVNHIPVIYSNYENNAEQSIRNIYEQCKTIFGWEIKEESM